MIKSKIRTALLIIFVSSFFSAALLSEARAASAQWQCVTFARSFSGIQIRGDAYTWWHQADGRYSRSARPEVGAVLAFKSYGKGGMRLGHVAVVSKVLSTREILITHANWTGKGEVDRDARAIDVSQSGDWSKVRVWYPPTDSLGITAFPTFGFIHHKG